MNILSDSVSHLPPLTEMDQKSIVTAQPVGIRPIQIRKKVSPERERPRKQKQRADSVSMISYNLKEFDTRLTPVFHGTNKHPYIYERTRNPEHETEQRLHQALNKHNGHTR
jgi:hypothetical protein